MVHHVTVDRTYECISHFLFYGSLYHCGQNTAPIISRGGITLAPVPNDKAGAHLCISMCRTVGTQPLDLLHREVIRLLVLASLPLVTAGCVLITAYSSVWHCTTLARRYTHKD